VKLNRLKPAAIGVIPILVGLAGLYALGKALNWWISGALLAAVVVAALPDEWKAKVLEFVGAVVVAIATLVGFNVVLDWVVDTLGHYDDDSSEGWILVGLAVGFGVFCAASYVYLLKRGHWKKRPSFIASALAAALFIIGGPIAYDLLKNDEESRAVPRVERVPSERFASKLDVFVVADKGQRSAPSGFTPVPALGEIDARFSVGFTAEDGVRWTLVDGESEREAIRALTAEDVARRTAPIPRDGSDGVLVLVVDGTPPVIEDPAALPDVAGRRDEVARWRGVARSAGLTGVPTYALVQTTERDRLARWAAVRDLHTVSVQELRSHTLTDAAVRLGIASSTARADFALAVRHRPILLFDGDEPVPRPLSIEALFDEGRIRQCPLRGDLDECTDPLTDPAQLENGYTRLELDRYDPDHLRKVALGERKRLKETSKGAGPPRLGGEGAASGAAPAETPPPAELLSSEAADLPGHPLSRMYVHPVARQIDGRSRLYLDYWWYLPDNPARAGSGAFCGAGLVIPGISCFDHQSDWEGVTVVLERSTPTPRLVAVHYAQHSSVVRYDWRELRGHWDDEANELGAYMQGLDSAAERPLVFIAQGTHASYPTPCLHGSCEQTADGLEEERHNGRLPWAGNGAATCGEGTPCLTTLPTLLGGSRPALWNAFTGPWGKTRCVLRWYCNSTSPPSAPGQQGRYMRPWACSGRVDLAKGIRAFKPTGCLDD
jgi:hypothetical protein